MKKLSQLLDDTASRVREIMPWDLEEKLDSENPPMILDIRERDEYDAMHIEPSIFVPRGILEMACEYDFDETVPELVRAREREIVVVCRSGNRSLFAADVMQTMGYENVCSLKTGLRGWNDFDQPMENSEGTEVDPDDAEEFLRNNLREDQLSPQS